MDEIFLNKSRIFERLEYNIEKSDGIFANYSQKIWGISQVELIEKAIYNENTNVDFYPVVKTAGAKDFKSTDIYKINKCTNFVLYVLLSLTKNRCGGRFFLKM